MNIEDDLNVINPVETDQQQQQQPKTALKLKKDPFANTHKWNDMLSAFCTQMPLKKHRRNLRAYSNCFAGWEAVDWMLEYLKTSADFKHLTLNRQNAVSILKILCKDKLFEDVRSTASSAVSDHSFNAKPFGDDDRLYRFSEKNAHYSKRPGITTSSISSSSSKKIAVAAAASSSSTASNSSISISSSATTTRTSSLDQDEMSLRHPQTTMSSLSSTTIELSAEMLSNKKRANKNETVIKEVPNKSGEVETSKRIFQNLNSHHVTNMASYKLGSRVGELSSLVEHNAAESSIEITKYKRISSPKKITGSGVSSGQEMTMTTRSSNTMKTTQDENIEPRGVLGVNNMQLVTTKLSTLRPQEAEIWSKMLRKSLESTLRRAVLTCNHHNATLWRDQIKGGRECAAGRQIESQLKQEPYQSTTLRRSYDIKIGLSKLLDKKAYEILQKAAVSSGPFISHNCNNVNKHGVVTCDKSILIQIGDDMPDWVIKGMHELINWDTKNTEKGFIAFDDVFQQIVKYYRSLNEPLLTAELSYLFLDVFEFLLFIKDSSNSLFQKTKPSGKSFSTTATSGIKQETSKSASNNTNIKQQSSSCSSLKIIEELIDDLRSQVKEERLKSSKTKDGEESGESSSKSGESSETRVNKIIRLMNESAANKSKTEAKKKTIKINENVESKLIEDAFLPVSFLVDNENDDDEDERDLKMSILAELNSLLELHEFNLTNRQKETIMQSLKPYLNQSTTRNNSSSMMSSIHNMTTRSSNVDKLQEFDEFLMEYKLRENGLKMSTTNSALSLTEVTNAYDNDEDEIDMEEEEEEEEEAEDEVDLDDEEDENYDVEYEVDYLEDDDDGEDEEEYVDDLYEACQLRRPPIKKKPMSSVNESDVVSVRSDLVISRRNRNDTMMTSSATTASMMSIDAGFSTIRPNHATTIQNHCNKNYTPNQIPTSSNSGNRVIQKSLSEKRLRRNNSFRAAIERLPTSGLDYNKKTMSKSSTFFSMSSNDNKNRFEANFKDDNSNIESSRVKSIKTKNKEENSGEEVELPDGYKTNKEATAQFKIPYPPAASELRQQPYLVVNHTNPNSNPNPNPNLNLLNPKLNTKKSTNSSQLRPSSASMVSLDAAASSIKRGAFQPMSPPSNSSSSSSFRALNQEFDSKSNVTCFSDSIPATSSNTVKQKSNNLSSQSMESSQVYSMIGAFRLLTLILPPKNRRKLHFLLRFLYKLKNADHTARNLSSVKQQQQQQTNKQSVLSIQQQVELFILSSFVSSIVAIEQKSSSNSNSNLSDDYQQKLALKLAQLFVDNYSEIMGIPQDFVLSVRQRLTSSLAVAPSTDDDLSSNKTNSDITNNSSAAKTTMTSVDSSNLFDSTTIKFGPHPFFAESSRSLVDFENPKMARKALNILGLNETTTTTTANSASQSHHFTKHQPSSKINFNNTTMFLRSATTSNMNETSQDFSSSSRSSGSSVPNSSKHFLTSSSISFSKFFNKKKKENLI